MSCWYNPNQSCRDCVSANGACDIPQGESYAEPCAEFMKLRRLLDEAAIPWHDASSHIEGEGYSYHTHRTHGDGFSVVYGRGTFGCEEGLLETRVRGVPDVTGHLTAKQAFELIKENVMENGFDICGYCCDWVAKHDKNDPLAVFEDYPKMMKKVLRHKFGMSKKAAKRFIDEACEGNWDRLHETGGEKHLDASGYAEMLLGDALYSSDRWSYDRVLRTQWAYMRLGDRLHEVF